MSPLADVSIQQPQGQAMPLAQPGAVPEQIQAPPEVPEPLNAVAAGQIPAVAVPPVHGDQALLPAQQFIVDNYEALPSLGLGLYEAQDMSTIVFNAAVLDEAMLAQAEQQGSLAELLQGPEAAPAPQAPQIAQARAEQRPAMPVQTAPAAPAMPAPKQPAGTADLLAKARVRNMGAGPQTPGIKPNPLSNSVARRPV